MPFGVRSNYSFGMWGAGYPQGNALSYPLCVKVRYFPRAGLAARMDGVEIYGSNTSPTTGRVLLHTLSGSSAGWNVATFVNATPYRYLIAVSSSSSKPECAELEFYDDSDVKITPSTTVASANYNPAFPATNAFDGNTGTECATDGTTPAYLGIECPLS